MQGRKVPPSEDWRSDGARYGRRRIHAGPPRNQTGEKRPMAHFASAEEVYEYIGGVFRKAGDAPTVGPKLRAANITMQVNYTDPASSLTVKFREPYEVIDGGNDPSADVTM